MAKTYFKCKICELNYVENDGDTCAVCQKPKSSGYDYKSRWFRTATCYHCQNELDSESNRTCPKCHWLKCNMCGACGCRKEWY